MLFNIPMKSTKVLNPQRSFYRSSSLSMSTRHTSFIDMHPDTPSPACSSPMHNFSPSIHVLHLLRAVSLAGTLWWCASSPSHSFSWAKTSRVMPFSAPTWYSFFRVTLKLTSTVNPCISPLPPIPVNTPILSITLWACWWTLPTTVVMMFWYGMYTARWSCYPPGPSGNTFPLLFCTLHTLHFLNSNVHIVVV